MVLQNYLNIKPDHQPYLNLFVFYFVCFLTVEDNYHLIAFVFLNWYKVVLTAQLIFAVVILFDLLFQLALIQFVVTADKNHFAYSIYYFEYSAQYYDQIVAVEASGFQQSYYSINRQNPIIKQ